MSQVNKRKEYGESAQTFKNTFSVHHSKLNLEEQWIPNKRLSYKEVQ